MYFTVSVFFGVGMIITSSILHVIKWSRTARGACGQAHFENKAYFTHLVFTTQKKKPYSLFFAANGRICAELKSHKWYGSKKNVHLCSKGYGRRPMFQ